jgi:large subunit ribosomal protein L29
MAKKKENLWNLSVGELNSKITDAREELMNLRFQQATGELTDYTRLRYTRRQIARMLTILGELERKAGVEGGS